jgi:hypothetical protein
VEFGLTRKVEIVNTSSYLLAQRFRALSSANRSDVWTSARERRIEDFAVGRIGTVRVQAQVTKAGDTVITAAVQDSDSHKTKLSILGTLPSCVCRCEVSFIVVVRGGDNICWLDNTTVRLA